MDDDQQHQQEAEATVEEPKGKRKKRDVVRVVHAEPTLFVDDAELIRRLGVAEKIARPAIYVLENRRDSGFPQKQVLGQSPVLASCKGMVRSAVWRARRTA